MNILQSNDLLFALWFFLPAGIANMTPVFAAHLPLLKSWDTPLDLGKKYRGKEIFGSNKTFRGLLSGSLVGGLFALLQTILWPDYALHIGIQNTALAVFGFGAALGFGALLGDSIESFFKRQCNIDSGKAWFPFDQIDYIIGGLVVSIAITSIQPAIYPLIIALYFTLHLITSYIGFLLGLKKAPI